MNISDLTNKNPETKLRSLLSLNDRGVQEIILFLQSHRDANYLIDLAMNDPVVSLHYNRLGYLINALHIQRRAEQRDINVHSYAFSGVRAITQAAMDQAIPVEAKIPQEQFAQSITNLTHGHEEGQQKTIVTAYLRWLAKKDTEYPDHSLGVVKKIYQIVMLLKQTEEGEVNAGNKVSSGLVIASLYESAIVYKDRDDKMFPPYDFSCHPGTEERLLDIVWPMLDSVVEDKSLSVMALVRMIASAHQDMFYQTVDMGHVKEPGLNSSFVKDLNRRIQQKLESNPDAIHKIEESREVPIGIPELMKCYEAVDGRYTLKQDIGIEGVQQDLPKQFDNIADLVTWGRGNKRTIVSIETVLRNKDAFVGEILQDIEIECSVFDPVLLYMPFATAHQPGKAHFQQMCSEYIEGRIAEYDASQAGVDEWGLSQQKEAVEAANAGISEEETPEDLKEYPYFDLGEKIEAALESTRRCKTLLAEKLWNSADVGIDYVSIALEDISHPMQLKLVNNFKESRKITAQNYEVCLGNRVHIAILLMQSGDKFISGQATEFIEQKVLPEGQYVCKRLQELGLYGVLDALINCIANMQDKLRLDLEFGGHYALDILSSDLLSLELLTTPDSRGHNTLMSAAYYGHTEVVKAILTRDKILAQVMLTTKDRDGQNALMLASKAGHTEVVKTFLAFKHLSNQVLLEKTKEGKNALMLAIDCAHTEVVKTFLAFKNLSNQVFLEKTKEGKNALGVAIEGYSRIGRGTISKRFDQHSDMMMAILARDDLSYFVQTGKMHDVESLLWMAISLAICDGDTELAKAFLAREDLPVSNLACDAPIFPFISPLRAAVCHGYIEILTMIVNKLANAGKLTFSDRQYLLRNGYFMLSFTENQDCLEAGGDIGADSVVVAAGNKSSIRLSSQWFYQVPIEKAKEGKNELMLAAWLGQKEIVQGILARDDLSDQMLIEKDVYGRNALVMAVMNGHTEVAKLILTRDSLPDQVLTDCYQGRNPLMWAALFGYVGVVEVIVSRRNLPHQVLTTEDGNDENALMVAATYNHLEVVEVILARTNLPDQVFMTTADSDKNILMKEIKDRNINLAEVVLARDNLPPSIFTNSYSDNVLTQAIEDGYIKIAKAILARPNLPAEALISYDSLGRSPLGLAAFYDYQEIAEAILDRDDLIKTAEFLNHVIWAQCREHCALAIAASHGHIDIIKAVLSQKHFSASLLINDANPILSKILESGYRPSTAVLELIVTQYAKLGVLTFSERRMLLRAGYVMLAFTANKSQLIETPLNTVAASTLDTDAPGAILGPNNGNAEGHHLDLGPGAEQPGL
ncbi:MAG: ankyrin repeat domain-containing protein [Pseudomonadota bacterium]|nr:ankyrin repeat domain-containing protein [Pseudomonadota bacterium]